MHAEAAPQGDREHEQHARAPEQSDRDHAECLTFDIGGSAARELVAEVPNVCGAELEGDGTHGTPASEGEAYERTVGAHRRPVRHAASAQEYVQQQRQQEGHSDHCQTRHVIPVNPKVVLEELVKFVPPARKGVEVHRVHETTRVGQLGWRRVQSPQVIRRAQSRDDHKHLRGYLVELTSSCLGGDLPVGANVG